MENDWFDRLLAAVSAARENGQSLRAISLSAGLNTHYLTQMTNKGNKPTVGKFIAICHAINADPVEILSGVKHDAIDTQILKLLSGLNGQQRKVFISMLESFQGAVDKPAEHGEPDDQNFLGVEGESLDCELMLAASIEVRKDELDITDNGLLNIEEFEKQLKLRYNQIYREKYLTSPDTIKNRKTKN